MATNRTRDLELCIAGPCSDRRLLLLLLRDSPFWELASSPTCCVVLLVSGRSRNSGRTVATCCCCGGARRRRNTTGKRVKVLLLVLTYTDIGSSIVRHLLPGRSTRSSAMLSSTTSRAVRSPQPVSARQGRLWFLSDAPRRAATVLAAGYAAGSVAAPRSVAARAGGSNPVGCLEASSWRSSIAPPVLDAPGDALLAAAVPSEERVHQVVLTQAALAATAAARPRARAVRRLAGGTRTMEAAYDRCGEVCKEYAKTFYLATQLMTPERRRAIWAIYVWCRRTDELVDGPNASHISALALDRWESRLDGIFAGQPYDMLDAALADTVAAFPVDVQPFRDMIEGMRMDLTKSRYRTFDELYLYCYYVAGTVGLMSVPVMGISPDSRADVEDVYKGALALGLANQLTNILRDVGEDARRGRIYLPQDELAMAGLSEDDIFRGRVTDRWRSFMRGQISRARAFFLQAEQGATELNQESRWPVWASLHLYRQILDEIEANDYDNFTKRAYVPKAKKLVALPKAFFRSLMLPSSEVNREQSLGRSDQIIA